MSYPDITKGQQEAQKKNSTTLDLTDPQVAGLDIETSTLGVTTCIACVHPALTKENIRSFVVFPLNLQAMSGWLKECGVTTVVMPKKSVIWEEIFLFLQELGFDLCLLEARRFNNISRLWRDGKDGIFEMINPNAAGIDIGSQENWVCVPKDRVKENIRCFGTFTCDLYDIAAWLKECNVTTVAMESTGVYWIPLYEILIEKGFEVFLVNARHLKNVPGRPKTDRLDCHWIQKLHSFGLLSASFRPDDEICKVRSLVRHRDTLIRLKAKSIQHMQKSLEQMNIKLANVISDIAGVSGLRIIQAILDGQRDLSKLAQLKDPRIKATQDQIVKSLQGNYRQEHLFTLRQSLEQFMFYQSQILACDQQIETYILDIDKKVEVSQKGQVTFPFLATARKLKKKNNNDPSYDASTRFLELTGVDLSAIDGLGANTLQTILFEVGFDMTKWPTAKHFTSWLGLAPTPKISGGKNLGNQTRKVINRAAQAFRLAAASLQKSATSLGAFFRRIRSRHGFKKAVHATARKLAIIFYLMLKNGTQYKQISEAEYLQKVDKQRIKRLARMAKTMGYKLVPDEK